MEVFDATVEKPVLPPSLAAKEKDDRPGGRKRHQDMQVQDFTVDQPQPNPSKAEALVEFIHVHNRVRKKVGEGTEFDPVIFIRAQEVIKNLAHSYLDAVAFDIADLIRLIRQVAQATDAGEVMPKIYKLAHEIKGGGGSFGFPLISRISASLCWFAEGLSRPAEMDFTIMKFHADAMNIVVRRKIKGHGGELGSLLAEGLEVLVAKRKAHDPTLVLTEVSKFLEKLDHA
jgi:hypothetical protein